MHGGQTTKNASGQAAGGEGADLHQAGVAHTGQGGLCGRETGSQPTGGDVAPTWAHHHHQGAWRWYRRRPEHSVGWRCWLAGEQGTHPDSQSRSLAGSRRRAGRGGARRGPGGAERRQAALRHSARGPVSPRARQAACRGDAGRQLTCPTRELLQHPTRQVGSRHATHATATRHDRHAAPARHVGHRVTRQAAAVTQPRRGGHDRAVDRASARSIEVFSAGWRAARLEQEAYSRAWLCPPRRHKHASGPLRRLAATRSARSLPPACVRMAFACSEARGSVVTAVTATRPVAFSGALEASWQGLGAPGLGWF